MDTGFVTQYSTVGRLSAANGISETAVSVLEETASRSFAHDPGCRLLIQTVCPAPLHGRNPKVPVPLLRRSTRANQLVPFTIKTTSAGFSSATE
jgi:hypothetical protein